MKIRYDDIDIKEYCEKMPYWEHLNEEEKQLVQENVMMRSVASGEMITSTDTECMGMVYIISGEVRVSMLSDEGREITLFCVTEGDSCVMTASCVIKQITFDTLVTANADTILLVVPSMIFAKLVNENIHVKAYMYEKETERFSSAMWVMQQILFKKFDVRLAEYFLEEYQKNNDTVIKQTQEEIARNVNSAREVVARMLRQFAADRLITVKRGSIILNDIDGLEKIIE